MLLEANPVLRDIKKKTHGIKIWIVKNLDSMEKYRIKSVSHSPDPSSERHAISTRFTQMEYYRY